MGAGSTGRRGRNAHAGRCAPARTHATGDLLGTRGGEQFGGRCETGDGRGQDWPHGRSGHARPGSGDPVRPDGFRRGPGQPPSRPERQERPIQGGSAGGLARWGGFGEGPARLASFVGWFGGIGGPVLLALRESRGGASGCSGWSGRAGVDRLAGSCGWAGSGRDLFGWWVSRAGSTGWRFGLADLLGCADLGERSAESAGFAGRSRLEGWLGSVGRVRGGTRPAGPVS